MVWGEIELFHGEIGAHTLTAELFWFRGSAVLFCLKGSSLGFPDPTFLVSGISSCVAAVSLPACKMDASS